MEHTARENEVAQVAHAFDRLRQGARLADLRLPRRLRAAVTHTLKQGRLTWPAYFWL